MPGSTAPPSADAARRAAILDNLHLKDPERRTPMYP